VPGTPTGTVTFKVDGLPQPAVALSATATATLTTSALAVGQHVVTASYSGNQKFQGSTSPAFTQTVALDPTATTLITSSASTNLGQTVTFTATVSPVAPGSGTPTGAVSFLDGGTTLGSQPLSNGQAALTISTLAAGTHSITAVYGGDSNFLGGSPPPLTQR